VCTAASPLRLCQNRHIIFADGAGDAQVGRKAPFAKPLKGFGSAGVLEVVDDFDGDTYRAVYTVIFAEAVYVLHAFEKKSRKGVATPRSEIELIKQRLERARQDYQQWQGRQKPQ